MEIIDTKNEGKSHTTILETNLSAIEHNLRYFKSLIGPECQIIAMVKASGYGAGDVEVARAIVDEGVYALSVAYVDEGVTLRQQGVTGRIIVLNADDESFDAMIAAKLEPEIYSPRSLSLFIEALRRQQSTTYPIHLKIDSGMRRLGIDTSMLEQIYSLLDSATDSVHVESIFSHLSSADVPDKRDFTQQQIDTFTRLSDEISSHLGYKPLRHIANSAAIKSFPNAHFDICRLGIGLYGYGTEAEKLHIASTLISRIMQIKSYPAQMPIGYGGASVTQRQSTIATIPIGYADGFNRRLSCGKWHVIVAGEKAPIIGRICMDSAMIDITGIEGVKEGDKVEIFSPTPGHTAEDMAQQLDTISYEVLTSLSKRVKRIYTRE